MSLTLKTRKVGDSVILDLAGRLTIGDPVLLVRESIKEHVNGGALYFVLNLAEVSYIDSSGLGELVATFTSIRNKHGDVKLLNLTKKVKDLLQMTKLLTVFDTHDDEAAALAAMRGREPQG